MKLVFIGDSLTSGENNNFKSYAHYYKENHPEHEVSIFGVSGACMGDYSIYPVKENMYDIVYELAQKTSEIHNADIIFFEYSINDTTAVTTGYANFDTVCISLVKTVDMIKQINADVKIYFIVPFHIGDEAINSFGKLHIEYLMYDYFKYYNVKMNFETQLSRWTNIYINIVSFIRYTFSVLYINSNSMYMNNLAEDNIHLNDNGYKKLSSMVDDFLREENCYERN